MTGTERGGVLIVRVWFEPGRHDEGFRARITTSIDIGSDTQHLTAATSPDAVMAVVHEWLGQMLARRESR